MKRLLLSLSFSLVLLWYAYVCVTYELPRVPGVWY